MKIEIDESEVLTLSACALLVLLVFIGRGCDNKITELERKLFIITNTPAMKN